MSVARRYRYSASTQGSVMRSLVVFLVVSVLAESASAATASPPDSKKAGDDDLYRIPDGFLLGAGISSYQMEGAWDADGKGINVMDHYFHAIGNYYGDTACDFYHRFKEDIALAASLKLNVFRLSISWARIFPDGSVDHVNEKGVQFYHNVLDELLKYNITPLVTIYHFDHPQALEDAFGGWLSEKMVDAFAVYANFLFKEYGEKVKFWLTLNEVNMHCSLVYGSGSPAGFLPPGDKTLSSTANRQLCLHHEILAHSAAYRIYRDNYKLVQRGMVGVGILPPTARANSSSLEDIYAAERQNVINIGAVLYPVVYGDYPEVLKAQSTATPLPTFTDDQRRLLRGTVDFAGFNAYIGMNVSASDQGYAGLPGAQGEQPAWLGEQQAEDGGQGQIQATAADAYWILSGLALWMNANFGDRVKVFITENGVAAQGGPPGAPATETRQSAGIYDINTRGVANSSFLGVPYSPDIEWNYYVTRGKYLRDFIYTINSNNLTNVLGYISWAFMDNIEFDLGISTSGMVHIDFDGKSLNRTPKQSALFFRQVMTTRVVPLIEASPHPSAAAPRAGALRTVTALLLLSVAVLSSHSFR